ncbi:hypothetical protein KAI58_01280 [Candidatus Gracilibacteria bacterium]|nr:hypothetical protein [Candidatus Gracilibacteria bacterium]
MKIILLTSDYHLAANIAIDTFFQKRTSNIEILGIISASTFCFDERSFRISWKFLKRSGLRFFVKTVLTNIWQTILLKIGKYFFHEQKREFFEIEELSKKNNIPFLKVSNINSKNVKNFIKKHSPDYIVSCLLLQLVKKNILELPRKGAINFHPALFEFHRGGFTSFWTLFKNRKKSGATVHFMTEKLDEGKIILQKNFLVKQSDSIFCINRKSAQLGGRLLVKALIKLGKREKLENFQKRLGKIFTMPTKKQTYLFRKKGKKIIHLKDLFRV